MLSSQDLSVLRGGRDGGGGDGLVEGKEELEGAERMGRGKGAGTGNGGGVPWLLALGGTDTLGDCLVYCTHYTGTL